MRLLSPGRKRYTGSVTGAPAEGPQLEREETFMSNSYQEITDVVQVYFDGLYECDTEKLASIFHPSSRLFANMDGEFVDWPREEWFEIVKTRVPPASTGQARFDKILSIDMSDDNTAVVTCECAIHPRYFTDYLSLIRIDGEWKIVSKSFRFDVHE